MTDDTTQAPVAASARPAPVVQLDKTKPFSENIGETTPDDPLHRVRFWQGQKFKGHMVLLPFDAQGRLVPDDQRSEPFEGMGAEGKKVTFHPLWNEAMRALFAHKTQRAATVAAAAPAEDEASKDAAAAHETDPAEDVNFAAWLKGEARYQPHVLRAAAKQRFSRNYQDLKQLVIDLVEDERIVAENEVCPALAGFLKTPAAA